ncbi:MULTISPECIES: hypothetical protein [unclassified Campylobacter]|uniref:hypothetical protein n=1 Tax=unclassified Campylobacter TaxID=2593542 RepID=UPI003D33D324
MRNFMILAIFCVSALMAQNLQQHIKECENKVAKSCSEVAAKLMQDDKVKAFELFKKACKLNDANACSVAGSFLIDTQNFKEAKIFFDKSCELKDKLGCEFALDLERSKKL